MTMTISQLADAAGCSERTIRRRIAQTMPGRIEHGKVTRLSEAECKALMAGLPKRNLVSDSGQMSTVADPLGIAAIVRETVAALVPAIVAALRGGPGAQAPAALPPPAELEPRDALRRIVEGWARGHGRDYCGAWGNLYREYGYRYHRDIARAAGNRGITVLDYAEAENIIGELLALAYFLYGQENAA